MRFQWNFKVYILSRDTRLNHRLSRTCHILYKRRDNFRFRPLPILCNERRWKATVTATAVNVMYRRIGEANWGSPKPPVSWDSYPGIPRTHLQGKMQMFSVLTLTLTAMVNAGPCMCVGPVTDPKIPYGVVLMGTFEQPIFNQWIVNFKEPRTFLLVIPSRSYQASA